ncbi:hypothetical protein EM20IM_02360 [Candidatus Methylacidiphilum infernorum]|uniref:Transposase n=1 Tax=Candidatus Methylacidiphilum infernorum TaxID=511746 RepID=A0ABX7PX90_9BACT|nr:hypothetical protein [Candidatus Methylacidiphilum infernorum]QSR87204.1 hypothetical protein EM20IM_02360 [Candidatus Methylacidiphilum infernorum]
MFLDEYSRAFNMMVDRETRAKAYGKGKTEEGYLTSSTKVEKRVKQGQASWLDSFHGLGLHCKYKLRDDGLNGIPYIIASHPCQPLAVR